MIGDGGSKYMKSIACLLAVLWASNALAGPKECSVQDDPFCLYVKCTNLFTSIHDQSRMDRIAETSANTWVHLRVPRKELITGSPDVLAVQDDQARMFWVIDPYGSAGVFSKESESFSVQVGKSENQSARRVISKIGKKDTSRPIPMTIKSGSTGELQLVTLNSGASVEGREFSTAGNIKNKPKALLSAQIREYMKTVTKKVEDSPLTPNKNGIESLISTIKQCEPIAKDLELAAQTEKDETLKSKLQGEAKAFKAAVEDSTQHLNETGKRFHITPAGEVPAVAVPAK
jgi:hypothetical protein